MPHAFEDVFWGSSSDPLSGVKKLHDNYQYGVAELEEILHFVSIRMQTEEYYANRLQEMAAVRIRPSKKNDDSSVGKVEELNTVLNNVLTTLRQEATIISSTHRHMHDTLNRTYTSLKKFLDDHRRLSQSRKELIDSATKRYETLASDVKEKRREASKKWDLAREADVTHKKDILSRDDVGVESLDVLITVADLQFTVVEFNTLVSEIERDVPKQDVKSIIGTYKSVVSGAAVIKYLMTNGAKVRRSLQTAESATAFLNALIGQGFLKSIALRNSNKLPVSEQQYQWKKTCLDNEPDHTRTRREAERAELEYKNAVKNAEEARVVLEAHCIEHMKTVQIALMERLTLAKTVISSYIDSEQSCISPITHSVERFNVLLEMFSPEQQVQVMAERDRTGNARLKPIVYSASSNKIRVESTYVNSVVFGVPLEPLAQRDSRRVPNLLRKCLRALVKGCVDSAAIGGRDGELRVWLESNMYAPTVQSLRANINGSGKPISLAHLRERPTSDIVGLIKLWLLQLPGSVCGDEVYEPLKLLYLSKSDEYAGMRSGSLKSLLSTLSQSSYSSLFALITHWQKLLAETNTASTDPKINDLSQVMGHLVLRPKVETLVTAFDKHPHRFLRDLLTHSTSEIFQIGMGPNPSSQSLQIEGEDLDPENDDDLDEEGVPSVVEEQDRIILLDAPIVQNTRMSISSSVSGYSGIGTGGAAGRDLLSNELDAVRLSVANKSDEDLFLEEEAEGLEDLNEEEMRRIEAEMDAMLAEDK
ncbi:hypothetical protein BCR33DRAFT_571540 [Rhizoclosmatium globosum]|uniref:Rho-GAP domain-containing protein n=1 Tax=Rhizoclosmatium globosum TaxID=329046 RepID=A0A1Y2B575_9FUNG|nr:hypothetical protein BCR33DRAFT_571540 [Rhizoclosmatium globosum]|eukprot:ORY29894.1 hypothetical protein BCR33DRAFT_571540 [Rhizoclosmatium globosum]